MAMSKMAGRKEDLLWLDCEQQAASLLRHVRPVELHRPLRPFVVLTLDTVDFARWLLGMELAAEPSTLSYGGAGKEEEDDGKLSIPRSISCLLGESSGLATIGLLLLCGAATSAGGPPLALASLAPSWVGTLLTYQNFPVAVHLLGGSVFMYNAAKWLTEPRLARIPRWFVQLCSANLAIGALFHLGMGALLAGGLGLWSPLPPSLMELLQSCVGTQLVFAPYYAIGVVTLPLTATALAEMARFDAYTQGTPLLYAAAATYCFVAPGPWEKTVWAASVLVAAMWCFQESKELRQAERATLRAWHASMQRQHDIVQLGSYQLSTVIAVMAWAQGAIIWEAFPAETLHTVLALTHVLGVYMIHRSCLRDSEGCEEILAIPGRVGRRTIEIANEPQLAG